MFEHSESILRISEIRKVVELKEEIELLLIITAIFTLIGISEKEKIKETTPRIREMDFYQIASNQIGMPRN